MAVRPEERFFFIYDRCMLQDQDDDITKSVLYFDPKSTPVRERYTLVGHVVGVLDCVAALAGSPVATFRLRDRNVVIKHVEHYVLGLSGEVHTPESVLCQLLDTLYDIFRFFHSSVHSFKQACVEDGRDFTAEFEVAWDCYLPFVRRYGDALSVGFQCIPFFTENNLKDAEVEEFCLRLLHSVTGHMPGALAGCILHQNKVVFTQLPSPLTSRLCIIQPKQNHLSCENVKSDAHLPEGVRLLSVYLSTDEYKDAVQVCQSFDVSRQFDSATAVQPTHPVQDNASQRDDNVNSALHHEDTEDTGVLLEGCSRETLIQQQDQYDATAISKSSAVPSNMSAEMCRPCYDTDSVAAVVGDCETVAQSTLSNNAQAIPAADHVICASVDSAELVPVELYIQGNSQTVFLLFMRQGCLSELDVVRDVWCSVLPQMAELEFLLQTSEDDCEAESNDAQSDLPEALPRKLNYLVYNCGKQQLSGNMMHPCRADEHSFCQRALKIHDELQHSSELVSKTFSSKEVTFSGIQRGSRQLFYQLPNNSRTEPNTLSSAAVNHLLTNS